MLGESFKFKKDPVSFLKASTVIVIAICFFWNLRDFRWGFFDNVDLIIHEAGHPIFSIFGRFIGMAGGTILQTGMPLAAIIYFLFTKRQLSAAIVMFWLGQSILNVSVYAADAIEMKLPLVGGNIHDWNYMLNEIGLLSFDHSLGHIFFGIANLSLHKCDVTFSNKATVCKYAVPEGYPDSPIKGEPLNVTDIENPDCLYFASVDYKDGKLIEAGSRTVAVVGIADTLQDAESDNSRNGDQASRIDTSIKIDGPSNSDGRRTGERDRSESLGFVLNLDPLLRLDRLVHPVAPAPALHQASRELIDDHDLTVLDDVVDVLLVARVRT